MRKKYNYIISILLLCELNFKWFQDGEVCSNKGQCVCGKCQCKPQWTGDDCSCSLMTDHCTSPYNNKICSKAGEGSNPGGDCVCNQCKCSKVIHKNIQISVQFADVTIVHSCYQYNCSYMRTPYNLLILVYSI